LLRTPFHSPSLQHHRPGLARNPLGIIALFIVLVYGCAALVTGFAGSLTLVERLPLVLFLVGCPCSSSPPSWGY
jgi:hypothetical protein